MRLELDIPEYSPETGLTTDWEYDFEILIQQDAQGTTIIKANQAGLISLAKHLLTLAQSSVPAGTHIHYDASNSLEDGSSELILEKS